MNVWLRPEDSYSSHFQNFGWLWPDFLESAGPRRDGTGRGAEPALRTQSYVGRVPPST